MGQTRTHTHIEGGGECMHGKQTAGMHTYTHTHTYIGVGGVVDEVRGGDPQPAACSLSD